MFLKFKVFLSLIPLIIATDINTLEESDKKVSHDDNIHSNQSLPKDKNSYDLQLLEKIYEASLFPKGVNEMIAYYAYSLSFKELKSILFSPNSEYMG